MTAPGERWGRTLHVVPCPGRDGGDCLAGRTGSTIQPTVILDEMPLPCGLATLRTYRPTELHLLEVYDRGGQIRVYTRDYMERTGRRPVGLIPADLPPRSPSC